MVILQICTLHAMRQSQRRQHVTAISPLGGCLQSGAQQRPEGIAAAVGLSPAEVSAVFGAVSRRQQEGAGGGGASLRRLSQLLQRVCGFASGDAAGAASRLWCCCRPAILI